MPRTWDALSVSVVECGVCAQTQGHAHAKPAHTHTEPPLVAPSPTPPPLPATTRCAQRQEQADHTSHDPVPPCDTPIHPHMPGVTGYTSSAPWPNRKPVTL
jgi:hypothetical protein